MSRLFGPRVAEADVDQLFLERWSPRAFSAKPVPEAVLQSLFEAARWAPSPLNDQPWLFLYAATAEHLKVFRPLLADSNRRWADVAPVLTFVFARRHFARDGKLNRAAAFVAGAAFMSLAIQARGLGLYTHPMGGYHEDEVYEVLGVPRERYELQAAVTIGYLGETTALPHDLQEREKPSLRKPLADVALAGRFRDIGAEP
jgi:nitroreductase